MRLLLVVLIALVGLVQYPLWLGKGGWFRVWSLQSQVAEQREVNEGLRARNAALAAEVQDLMTGTGALEERARGDLGMMRESEVFVQILPHDEKPPAGARPNGDAAGIRPAATATPPARPSTTAPAARGTVPAAARGTIGAAPAAPARATAAPARATAAPANTTATPARATPAPANATAARPAAAPRATPARAPANQPATGPAVATPIPAPSSAPR